MSGERSRATSVGVMALAHLTNDSYAFMLPALLPLLLGKLGPDARLSVPTPEHYLPLLYVLGTRQEGESTMFPIEGVDGGSISMLAVRVGH